MLACIAAMTNGKPYPLQNPKMEEGKTTPKKHFTEDSLLSAMERAGADEMPDEAERKGIGTSATRAATIEKLVRIGFVERKGNKKTKYLMPTHKGVALITVMPEQIQSPSMTAEWEQKLLDVEKGNFQDTEFMSEIEEMITDLVKTYKVIEDAEVLMHPAMEEIGTCPCCGQRVIERQKGYYCENRGCNFVLWKQNRFFEALGKKMTKQTAIKLLTDGKVALKGCKSKKTGKTYDTTVFRMTLGRKIKECRKKKGMTQEALAEALFTNKSTISEYENDKIDLKISVLREIAVALDTPVSYLLESQEPDIEDEMIQMLTALKQIKSCELRKAAIAQVRVLAGVM